MIDGVKKVEKYEKKGLLFLPFRVINVLPKNKEADSHEN